VFVRGLLVVLLGWLAGCDSVMFRAGFEDQEDALLYKAAEVTEAGAPAGALLVLNYNIKYGGARLSFFWECNGTRYNMTETEVSGQMQAIAEFITWLDPDIVLLQEVDRQSLRSTYMDQLQYLLNNTPLNYGAYAAQHKVDFLPSDGMGHMDFGNATLSRWPIVEATRISLPLVSEYPGYYQYFYLKRHILQTRIQMPFDENFMVINTHLEAFSDDGTKKEQIDQLHDLLIDLDGQGLSFVGGGDLNSLPAGSAQLKEFPDDCPGMFEPDDYSGEEDWLDELFADFNSAMSLGDYQADNASWFSYTGNVDEGWTRTLDYLFTNGEWVDEGAQNMVMQNVEQGGYETLPLSDHAPVQAFLEVP